MKTTSKLIYVYGEGQIIVIYTLIHFMYLPTIILKSIVVLAELVLESVSGNP